MKRNLFFVLFACLLAVVSCKKQEDWGEASLTVDAKTIEFTQDGGSHTVKLLTNREWKVECDADWVIVSQETGKASKDVLIITITVPANVGADRKATLTFNGGIVSVSVSVSQKGPDGETDGIQTVTVKELIDKADPKTTYRLTGVVTGKFTSNYTTFNLKDDTGSILVYSFKSDESIMPEADVKNGATITLTGRYEYYEQKQQHEIKDAVIEKYTAPQEEDISKVQQISCAEFISKADQETTYRLVGTVTSAVNTQYCSFDMNDGTATVVVWTVNNASEWGNTVKKGGQVTVRGKYLSYTDKNGVHKDEMVDAYIEAFTPGEGGDDPEEEVKTYKFVKASSIESGKKYIIVSGKVAAKALTSAYGYLKIANVSYDEDGVLYLAPSTEEFTFTQVEGGWTIQQSDGKYLYQQEGYNSFSCDDSAVDASTWSVETNEDGQFIITNLAYSKYIQYSTQYTSFGSYAEAQEGGELPTLYYNTGEEGEAPGAGSGDTGDYASTVKWTLGSNAYDGNSDGNSKQSANVNGTTISNLLKIGKSSAAGDATLKVPAGSTKLVYYAVCWKGTSATLQFSINGSSVGTQDVQANTGAAGNPPYTLSVSDTDRYTLDFGKALENDTEVKVTTTASARVIFFGIKAE